MLIGKMWVTEDNTIIKSFSNKLYTNSISLESHCEKLSSSVLFNYIFPESHTEYDDLK